MKYHHATAKAHGLHVSHKSSKLLVPLSHNNPLLPLVRGFNGPFLLHKQAEVFVRKSRLRIRPRPPVAWRATRQKHSSILINHFGKHRCTSFKFSWEIIMNQYVTWWSFSHQFFLLSSEWCGNHVAIASRILLAKRFLQVLSQLSPCPLASY